MSMFDTVKIRRNAPVKDEFCGVEFQTKNQELIDEVANTDNPHPAGREFFVDQDGYLFVKALTTSESAEGKDVDELTPDDMERTNELVEFTGEVSVYRFGTALTLEFEDGHLVRDSYENIEDELDEIADEVIDDMDLGL